MIQTNNLYFASYLHNEGLSLTQIRKEPNEQTGEICVYFVFEGEQTFEGKLSALYERGKAKTNVKNYLTSLTKIRSTMYSVLNGQSIYLGEQPTSSQSKVLPFDEDDNRSQGRFNEG